jgi:hypothetical protein
MIDRHQLINGPEWSGLWTGDGWKAIAAIRAARQDVDAFVINCEHGVGVVCRRPNTAGLRLSSDEIKELDYDDLTSDSQRLIGLRRPVHLLQTLRHLRHARERNVPTKND